MKLTKIFLTLFLLGTPSIAAAGTPCEREVNNLAMEAFFVHVRTSSDNEGNQIYTYTHDRRSVDALTRWVRVCADIQKIPQVRQWERDEEGYVSAIFDCKNDPNHVLAIVGNSSSISMSPLKVK